MTQDFEQVIGADILIVDDTPDNIRFLSSLLTKKGYKVRKALNGHMALIAAKTLTPDLILLDINMPEMDGYEVCKRLKEDEVVCSIPVIFLSAWDAAADKVKAFEVGGTDYITKPFQFEEVLVRIENQLNLRNLQKQLQIQNSQLKRRIESLNQSQRELIQRETVAGFEKLAIGIEQGMGHPLSQISNYLATSQQVLPLLLQLAQSFPLQSVEASALRQLIAQFPHSGSDLPETGLIDASAVLLGLVQMTHSAQTHADQMQAILSALQTFVDLETPALKAIDIHQSIDCVLLLLQPFFALEPSRRIELIKTYGELPPITCYANLFSLVLFKLLSQVIDISALKKDQTQAALFQPTLCIKTELSDRNTVLIYIQENSFQNGLEPQADGSNGLPPSDPENLSTWPGNLLMCQGIIEEIHQGNLTYRMLAGGAEFTIEMPVNLI